MTELSLGQILDEGLAQELIGDPDVRVRGVRFDSRAVEPGELFAALPGVTRHGEQFIDDAVARGAAAVISDRRRECSVPLLLADDVLAALAAVARRLYDDPSTGLAVVGITGTNGKTTTSFLIESMLQHLGARPAVIGSVNFRAPGGVRPATHTTPMADDLMRLTRWAVDSGATHLVLEVSSHGLAMRRADGLHYRVAAFTNLSQDHLDYHGDFEAYGAAKARLFTDLQPQASVINVDDAFGAQLAARLRQQQQGGRLYRVSRRADVEAELRVLELRSGADGIVARVATPLGEGELRSPLLGDHNVENLMVALGCGLALGESLEAVLESLSAAPGAPGRLERVQSQRCLVLVDYAHTPDALSRALAALRPLTSGRLLSVFGCGGDRDRGKRPMMGRAAIEGADLAIVTDDNPRTEDPAAICEAVVAAMDGAGVARLEPAQLAAAERGYLVARPRDVAIELALSAARPGDTVLIAGKGHEDYQILGTQKFPFDDRVVARRVLRALEAAVGGGEKSTGGKD
ncbi:MAG: UDP-N-acetylmuramoyl-L-alanyl-D-glutamate--2,6-diaminopimelate ligase [Myxococcales bacterium]|nr:UDP-N-acetylmuramoyl-L-alanyl-D-glutamate--2,6-diaminopimelate ligase [Myxococcales bacterium]